MAQSKPLLPNNRAFVIQFRGDADIEHGECRGRIEHFVSAQADHFDSIQELMAIIVRILATQRQQNED